MIAARLIRDADALEALAPAWWDLWRRTDAPPFQSPAWLLPWWRVFAPGELVTIMAEADGRLVGLAPFYIEDGALGRRLLPLGIGITDYLDVILDPGHADEAGCALAKAAVDAGGWDVWECEELRPGASALALPCLPSVTEAVSPQSPCPVLTLGSEDVLAIVPKAQRRKIHLARNRAARRGGLTIGRADAATVGTDFDHLVRLHSVRWQSRGEEGVLADASVIEFHRLAAPALQAAGLLRLYILSFDGDVAAAIYGLHHRDGAYTYLTGFDPAFTFESPGTLLAWHAIEMARAEGARHFHFLRGNEAYKYEWGAVDAWNRRRTFRRSDPRHAAA